MPCVFQMLLFFPSILFTTLVPQDFVELLDIHTVFLREFLGERGAVFWGGSSQGWAGRAGSCIFVELFVFIQLK